MKTTLQQFLDTQKANHLYRARAVVDSPQAAELLIDGKSYLNFCSNDYLGHANHPKLAEAFINGVRQYGVGSGASHLISGHSRAHHELEEALAAFVGRPRALLFSTGYMANLGVISALLNKGDHVFEDRINHASLLDGGLLSQARLQRYLHADARDLLNKLGASKAQTKLVASDGVFSMDGDLAPVKALASAAQRHNAWLMIDDAHGLGVVGERGRGVLELLSITNAEVPILVGTLGKAFGTFGAFVAGNDDLIETLIQKARSYIYTTALPPAIAVATLASLRLIDDEAWRRDRLRENVRLFRELASQAKIPLSDSETAIQPVILGDVEPTLQVSHGLKQQGILVTAIRPPTVPQGTARLRITMSAEHTSAQITRLIETLHTLGVGQ
ncbi:MAG: 8-amino-7-oxononanoate synthase [Gammaproteobacteria bacterium]|nr:8-amino-7-oxononanoate synthase [Gammaproteobacteria bacterium]